MAKAVNKIDPAWKRQIGRAVERCFALAGLTDKEAAALIDKDTAQIARWIAGEDRPQLDAIFAVACLRQPLVVALSELAGDVCEIETVVRMKRRA